MDKNRFSLFEEQSDWENSLMRSVLIFGFTTHEGNKSDQLKKAILSIVIYGKGDYGIEQITSVFNTTFKLNQVEKDILLQLDSLCKAGLIERDENGLYKAVETDKKGVSFFEELEKDTEVMLKGITEKVCKKYPLNNAQKAIIRKNTKKALSLYFQINSLAAFGIQDLKIDESKVIVEAAMSSLDNKIGKYLVSVLAYTIEEPGKDKDILEKWAKTVVTMRSTGLDPMLRNFKQQQLANKKFILDTDVVLNALATNARYSTDYRKMIRHLVNAGAKVLIPQFVYNEVVMNADSAIRRFTSNGRQILEYPDEVLEDSKSNVFIEDYVKTIRKDQSKKDMNFATYMGNIYSERSQYTLNQNIIKLLGERNGNDRYILKDNVLNEEKASTLKELIKDRAKKTPKGSSRTIEQQEEMALNDTRLYLTICDENIEKEKSGILGYQCYLVTRSTRTMISASELGIYDKHVVCHPQTLISVLDDIGQINDVVVINLFDNPFLTYMTELIMDQVDPVIRAGAQIKHYEFIQLREKFDLNINNILTAKGAEYKKLLDEYTKEGLLFAKDMDELLKKTERQDKELSVLKTKNERLEQENTKLKGRVHYLNQLNNAGKIKIKTLRDKKKK